MNCDERISNTHGVRDEAARTAIHTSIKIAAAAVVALFATGVAAPAQAQTMPMTTMSANVGVVSEYIFRGVSQVNDKDAAIQGGVDMGMGIGYFGLWASRVDFGNGTDIEYDIYGGIKPSVGGHNFDLGVVAYRYTDSPSNSNQDFYELKAGVSRGFGALTLGAVAYWSPDTFGTAEVKATYYEVNAAMPIAGAKSLGATAVYGRQTFEGTGDYNTWNIGATWSPAPWLSLDVRYHDTDEHSLGTGYKAHYIAGTKVSFNF